MMNIHKIVKRILEADTETTGTHLPENVKKEIINYDETLRPADPIMAGINKIIEIKDNVLEKNKTQK